MPLIRPGLENITITPCDGTMREWSFPEQGKTANNSCQNNANFGQTRLFFRLA